jgi:hypothetical protein
MIAVAARRVVPESGLAPGTLLKTPSRSPDAGAAAIAVPVPSRMRHYG